MSDMADVLVAHQRQNAGSCLCGWSELGKSHPAHQAAALSAAGFGPVQEARAEVIAEMLEDADAESKHANWQNERHTANLVHDWIRTWDDEQRSRTERGGQ